MKKKIQPRICSHCDVSIPVGEEYLEFKGSYFHPDHLKCIGNLKVTVETLRRKLIEINSITNNIP